MRGRNSITWIYLKAGLGPAFFCALNDEKGIANELAQFPEKTIGATYTSLQSGVMDMDRADSFADVFKEFYSN